MTGPTIAFDADRKHQRECEYHRRMAQGEEEPDRKRSLPVAHQLAGGVVDRRDMVGVKCVPQPQGVGGQPDAQTEGFAAHAEMVRGDERGQGDPADQVQGHDHPHHGGDASPLRTAQQDAHCGQPRGVGIAFDGCHGISS